MKKLLSLIGAISIVGSGASAVISCGDNSPKPTNDNQAKADAIKNKITNADLAVVGVSPGTQNAPTINAIKTALRSENPILTTDDLAKITFNTVNLKDGEAVTVKATITVGTAKAEKDLKVTLAKSDQQKADAIKDKITQVALTVSDTTKPDLTDATPAIRIALQSENPTLTDDELQLITFTGANLEAGKSVTVKAVIAVETATAEKDLNVTLAQTDQQKADAIKDKITDDTFNIPAGTNPDTTNTATITEIRKALQTANATLTADDLMKINFSPATLRPFTSVAVTATITVGTGTATKDLNLTIATTDQEKADRIKNRITHVDLDIAIGTNPDTTNPATIQVIKTALQGANSALTTEDLATISFSNTTLQAGTSVVVKAIINVGTATAERDLNVTLAQSDQQKADAIRNKINDVDLTVPVGTNPDTTITTTIDAIKVVLEADNVALTASDLNVITFSDTTLQAGISTQVMAIITIGMATAQKDLNVTLAQTDQQKADAIRNKINDVDLTIPAGTNTDTTNPATIQAIKTALETENQTLNADDLRTITLANATLQSGNSVVVKATINVGAATAEKDLNVTLAQTDQQKANAIKDKITTNTFNISAGTNPDTTNPATITAIRTALQNANPTLTSGDLATIGFSDTTLQAGASVTVTATITVGTATATIDLDVTLTQTDQQKADAIKDKITNVNLDIPAGTDPDTTNATTISAIKTALKGDNPTLTDNDLSKISIPQATLQAGSRVVVKATINVGAATAEKDLNITLAQTDQQKADAIIQKITTINYDYTHGAPANTNSQTVRFYIIDDIYNGNYYVSFDDLNTLSVQRGVQLVRNTPVALTITCNVGSGQATKVVMFTWTS